jgi:hypothetical protein
MEYDILVRTSAFLVKQTGFLVSVLSTVVTDYQMIEEDQNYCVRCQIIFFEEVPCFFCAKSFVVFSKQF